MVPLACSGNHALGYALYSGKVVTCELNSCYKTFVKKCSVSWPYQHKYLNNYRYILYFTISFYYFKNCAVPYLIVRMVPQLQCSPPRNSNVWVASDITRPCIRKYIKAPLRGYTLAAKISFSFVLRRLSTKYFYVWAPGDYNHAFYKRQRPQYQQPPIV